MPPPRLGASPPLDSATAPTGLERVCRFTAHLRRGLRLHRTSASEEHPQVSIVGDGDAGSVSTVLHPPSDPRLVPRGFIELLGAAGNQEVLRHLRFLMQKDGLRQDTFLLGPPGLTRRAVAFAYCELAEREVEFLSVSQDTTVADLKQRREIRSKTAIFVDGPAVRAAIYGRVLVIEGVQSAERNLLSVLNNLLENREMALEDGRFLTSPSRYDALLRDVGTSGDGSSSGSTGEVVELPVSSPVFQCND